MKATVLSRPIATVAISILAFSLAHAAGETMSCPAGDASASPPSLSDTTQSDLYTRPEATVPPVKRTVRGLYLTARDAYAMVQEDPSKLLFIDVRTRGELQFIGVPALIDANVPYMIEATPAQWDEATSSLKLVLDPDFVQRIGRRAAAKGLDKDSPIILICQAGIRAARAADLLTRAGYTKVYAVIDGFEGDPVPDGPNKGLRLVNGWRNAGLPWSTRLERGRIDGLE